MVDLDEMAEEQDQMLRELAELGMDFARELKAQVKLVKSVEDAGLLARAYERVVRGVRLTLALRSRLVREHLEIGRLARDAASKAADRRKAQIRAVLEPEIFTEDADQDQADTLRERLVERLDDDALFDQFLSAPFETAVARIRKDIGLEVGAEAIDPPPGRSPIEGEVDRALGRETEGVEAHCRLHGLQPPQSAALTAPPEREQLEGPSPKPVPS